MKGERFNVTIRFGNGKRWQLVGCGIRYRVGYRGQLVSWDGRRRRAFVVVKTISQEIL